jgi:2-polyprenyl-3-methyl-5-hydroxy-6-metoxy-1,4-benzoquinol methylase
MASLMQSTMHNDGRCRFCSTQLSRTFVDLGRSPLANSLLQPEDLSRGEIFYPLHVYVCENCLLVQLQEFARAENIFNDYPYFSSYSKLWLDHCRDYAGRMVNRLLLNERSLVVEIASNDGYLLQYFKERDVGVLGIEPAANVAAVALSKGIDTKTKFFGSCTAQGLAAEGKRADLMVANNVLAHVPDLHDFVEGFRILLKPSGTATFEFPHLLNLVEENQFDTIYHEHFSYFSFLVVKEVFYSHGLRVYGVERLRTHGGSLRIFVCHADAPLPQVREVDDLVEMERAAGIDRIGYYEDFAQSVIQIKCELLDFLINARRAGKTVVGYGAPAKGNTLLNYCGVGPELLAYTVDINPHKQRRYLPGVQIPIHEPERIFETKPDYVLILPWNIKEEIIGTMERVREWGARFVVAIPALTVLP